jgi:anti-anti-sigma factor
MTKLLSITKTFSAIIEVNPHCQILHFSGFLDAYSVPNFNSMMDKYIEKEVGNLILDLYKVEFLDSAGLGALVRLVHNFKGNTLIVAQGMIAKLIKAVGLSKFLSLQSTIDEAILKFQP